MSEEYISFGSDSRMEMWEGGHGGGGAVEYPIVFQYSRTKDWPWNMQHALTVRLDMGSTLLIPSSMHAVWNRIESFCSRNLAHQWYQRERYKLYATRGLILLRSMDDVTLVKLGAT